jgi:hypothetical protein
MDAYVSVKPSLLALVSAISVVRTAGAQLARIRARIVGVARTALA